MNATLQTETQAPLMLRARTAADVMAPNPVSIRSDASFEDAVRLFTTKGVTSAPVINDAGHPIGVLSRSDLLIHERENLKARHEGASAPEAVTAAGLMTPAVFAVPPETPLRRVVEEMLALHVHSLFVVDGDGVLVGVVSAMDLVRHLE